jgi:hypothetical protein
MIVFDGEPRCHIDTCFFVSKQKTTFLNTKSKSFFNMTLFEGGSRCQTKSHTIHAIIDAKWRHNSVVSYMTSYNINDTYI